MADLREWQKLSDQTCELGDWVVTEIIYKFHDEERSLSLFVDADGFYGKPAERTFIRLHFKRVIEIRCFTHYFGDEYFQDRSVPGFIPFGGVIFEAAALELPNGLILFDFSSSCMNPLVPEYTRANSPFYVIAVDLEVERSDKPFQ